MCGLRYQAFRQPVDRVALTVADYVAVDPKGYTDIAMAELIPDYGDWGSALDQFRRDRVSEPALDMTRKSRRPAKRNLPTRTDSIRDRTSTTKSRNRKLVERLSGMTWTYRP